MMQKTGRSFFFRGISTLAGVGAGGREGGRLSLRSVPKMQKYENGD